MKIPARSKTFTSAAPVVLASSGQPAEKAVSETVRVALALHRPVLLVHLITPAEGDQPAWVESVWARLVARGVHVSAQAVLTQEPERVVKEMVRATGASYVVLGQLGVRWTMTGMKHSVSSQNEHLWREYESQQALFEAQPVAVQRFLEAQARQLAGAVTHRPARLRFTLPEQVVASAAERKVLPVPAGSREQTVGGWFSWLTRANPGQALCQRLVELAGSHERAVAISGRLIRHATVMHLVRAVLPSGRPVAYVPVDGEEIPTIPVTYDLPAITAAANATAEEGQAGAGGPAAGRFYLPQWVVLDEKDHLLVESVEAAEAAIASMQQFVAVLHAAAALAPYIIADEDYQHKRYGMLGQLVNQGRALARYRTGMMIRTIKRRAQAHDLDQGLRLSLPYFDDQTLRMEMRDIQVIPAGRLMFVLAFVVLAMNRERAEVAQDTRLNRSTRNHLLAELKLLEEAFVSEPAGAPLSQPAAQSMDQVVNQPMGQSVGQLVPGQIN